MRKIIITILLCSFMTLGVTGCEYKNRFDMGNKSDIQILEQEVSLTIKEGT